MRLKRNGNKQENKIPLGVIDSYGVSSFFIVSMPNALSPFGLLFRFAVFFISSFCSTPHLDGFFYYPKLITANYNIFGQLFLVMMHRLVYQIMKMTSDLFLYGYERSNI